MAEGSAQARLLTGVAEAFGLDGPPERIEVYDNSHIMGTNAVGGMIVAGRAGGATVGVVAGRAGVATAWPATLPTGSAVGAEIGADCAGGGVGCLAPTLSCPKPRISKCDQSSISNK
jgi:hypothetical protein